MINILDKHAFKLLLGISTPKNSSSIIQHSPIQVSLGVLIRKGDYMACLIIICAADVKSNAYNVNILVYMGYLKLVYLAVFVGPSWIGKPENMGEHFSQGKVA